MQGWPHIIPAADKVRYLNALLELGFDTLDCGSFVSPKAIPQMADTAEVLARLDLADTKTKLLTIIANTRGAEEAVRFDTIQYLGFPFSVSPTFQLRNTNSTQEESLTRVKEIQNLCLRYNKELVIYLSMGFGNPYGDVYSQEILLQWADAIAALDIRIISLADTVGLATATQIRFALETLIPAYPQCDFGVHLHAKADDWKEKVEAAITAGCQRMDGAVKGIGGCPMAQDDLVGNLDTLSVVPWLQQKGFLSNINPQALSAVTPIADQIFI
jgi:hydroxymethylglutaryl-CoA lyase